MKCWMTTGVTATAYPMLVAIDEVIEGGRKELMRHSNGSNRAAKFTTNQIQLTILNRLSAISDDPIRWRTASKAAMSSGTALRTRELHFDRGYGRIG